jgi:hypothetical protein
LVFTMIKHNTGVWRRQVAQRAFNPLVVGSNPTTPSFSKKHNAGIAEHGQRRGI